MRRVARGHGQGGPGAGDLTEQPVERGIGAVALDQNGERRGRERGQLGQQLEHRVGHVVAVIVEETAAAVARGDPLAARQVDEPHAVQRQGTEGGDGVEFEVEGVRMEVVQVEQQIASGGGDGVGQPGRLVTVAAGRVDQRGDVLERR